MSVRRESREERYGYCSAAPRNVPRRPARPPSGPSSAGPHASTRRGWSASSAPSTPGARSCRRRSVPLQLDAELSETVSGSSSVPAALPTSLALVVQPMDQGRTRLMARGLKSEDWLAPQGPHATSPEKPIFIERIYGLLAKMPWPLLLPVAGFGHYLMESRMLRGIKRKAERRWAQERANAKESSRAAVHR